MRPATVVIPMAGRGSRFAEVGFDMPKPLIPVFGEPMYSWAMRSIPDEVIGRLVFVCLDDHLDEFPLGEDIRKRYARFDPVIVPLAGVTDGQACTVIEAHDVIEPDEPLIIYNADTYAVSHVAETLTALPDSVAGVIGVFEPDGDHWSFARVDDAGRVLETAEKRRISPWATTGLYHFSRARDFLVETQSMIADDDRTNGEFYVAPLYNRLIRRGSDIRTDVADEVWALGTPEELAYFEAHYPHS